MHHSHCFIKKLGFLGFCGKSFLNVWGKIKFFICRDALAISCFCLHFIQVCEHVARKTKNVGENLHQN